MIHFLINLLLGLSAGAISLYVLRSLAKQWNDGIRVIFAVIIGLIVFLLNLASYITINQ